MTLTRLAFFKLLGVVGIRQAIKLKPNEICCPDNMGQSRTTITFPQRTYTIRSMMTKEGVSLVPDGHGEWIEEPPCAEGESRCPIGHCQKPSAYLEPKPIWGKGEREGTEMTGLTMMYYEPGKWIAQRVCSVCGIVYVPQEKESK